MSDETSDVARLADHMPRPRPGEATAGAVRMLTDRAETAESGRATAVRQLSEALAERDALAARLAAVEALADRPAAATSGTGGHIAVVLVEDLRKALWP